MQRPPHNRHPRAGVRDDVLQRALRCGESVAHARVGEKADEPEATPDEADEHRHHACPGPESETATQRDHEQTDDDDQDSAGNRQRETRGETERHQCRRMKVGQKRVQQRGAAEERVDRRDVAPRCEARRGGEVLRPVRPHSRVSSLEPTRIREDGVREDRDDHRRTAQECHDREPRDALRPAVPRLDPRGVPGRAWIDGQQ